MSPHRSCTPVICWLPANVLKSSPVTRPTAPKLYVKPAPGPGEPGAVQIVGTSAERGDNEGTLDASVEGEALNISFNIRYLIDVLNVINDERVVLESNGAANPGVIRPENRDDFVSVIMPMQVTR